MGGRPAQLALDLAHRAALGAEDFLVSGSNAAAVELIDRWPDWPHAALVVVGPAGSGKSHLANVWAARSGAERLAAGDLIEAETVRLAAGSGVILEDVERGRGEEQALFHLLNLAREKGFAVLLTARTRPGEWHVSLPDLRSRLRSLPVVTIEPPDDALLRAVLVKLFADRQLAVEPAVIAHIALRMERSMAMAQQLVGAIDREALASRRKVSRTLVGEVLARLGSNDEGVM